jgi:hypothetical protein
MDAWSTTRTVMAQSQGCGRAVLVIRLSRLGRRISLALRGVMFWLMWRWKVRTPATVADTASEGQAGDASGRHSPSSPVSTEPRTCSRSGSTLTRRADRSTVMSNIV